MALVVLDASVVIAFWDANDAHHPKAFAALDARRGDELVLPASAYSEVLVGPFRAKSVAPFEQMLSDLMIRVEPTSAQIARLAAELRSRRAGLKLPDALILATGDVLDAAVVLTADDAWKKLSRRVRTI